MPPRRNLASSKKQAKPLATAPKGNETDNTAQLPLEVQQLMLNQFQQAFPFDSSTDVYTVIQTVKGHLYNRDFLAAFSEASHQQAYALRWSASRALAYAQILTNLDFISTWHLAPVSEGSAAGELHDSRAYSVACIGGGAGAELVALAAALHTSPTLANVQATAIDIADWTNVVQKLETSMKQAPPLSKYAGEAIKASNYAFIDDSRLALQFMQQDILECKDDELKRRLGAVDLCTIMFTLNELFTASIGKTTTLLLKMTEMMPVESHLLIVDSPGSYSEVKLGKDGTTKQYPMKWLLDHTLLKTAGEKWEQVLSDDSRWFRLHADLKYPIELENMRYQIHLYRRLNA